MSKVFTDNSKVNINLIEENKILKKLLEIERHQVKRLSQIINCLENEL